MNIEWADPPAAQGSPLTRREQCEFAEQLRDRPGNWAVLPTNGSSVAVRALASRINRQKQSAFGEGFEAVTRSGTVYVRFIGEQE